MDSMIDAADLHRAADRIGNEGRTPLMDQLAAAGAQFIQESDLWATGDRPTFLVDLDPVSLGYGIMLGFLAAADQA